MQNKYLCALTAIVKNESGCIKRMLESIKDLVDFYIIVDTGSSDNTKDIIGETCRDLNKPYKIIEYNFTNFGECRNIALEESKKNAIYSIWLDADEFLVYPNEDYIKDLKTLLLTEQYSSVNISCSYDFSSNFYWRKNIVKNDLGWSWVGKIHEYINSENDLSSIYIDEIKIQLTADGNSHKKTKKEKYEFYLNLLKEDWDETKNPRWLFYIGQTYQDLGELKWANQYYKLRCKYDGYFEEKYISCLRISRILKSLNEEEWIYKAFECSLYDSDRIEHLYDIAYYFYSINQFHNSKIILLECFDKLKKIDIFSNRFLFIESAIYNYKVYDLLYVIAHLLKEENLLKECKILLKNSLHTITNSEDLKRIKRNLI